MTGFGGQKMTDIILPEDQRWCFGFEGIYAASYDGEIWSYRSGTAKKMVGGIIYDKKRDYVTYRVACLSKDGKTTNQYFHRLVAEAWIPNSENKPQINHIDHNKLNNCVDNLEWVTPSENVQAMYAQVGMTDRIREKHQKNKGFKCKQDYIDFIHKGDLKGFKTLKTIQDYMGDDVWLEAGVPKEITEIVFRSGSYLENWNLIITYLDEVFDLSNKLSVIEAMFYLSYTLPSHIRAGRRWQKEVELYKKYRNHPEYLKFYEKTYSVNK